MSIILRSSALVQVCAPELEKRCRPHLRRMSDSWRERFLGTRTGILLVLQQTHAQIEDAALVSSHEERKGILVSLLTGFHQLCFVLLA
jgi:hypothetical protein